MKNLEITKNYESTGNVLGNNWGGGKGSYECRKYTSKISIDDLLEQNNLALKSGSLVWAMGFESLIGAVIYVTTYSEFCYENKVYVNAETETYFIGELTENEKDFLKIFY